MSQSPLMPVYPPSPANFVEGRGVELFDDKGNRYLDFVAGIATNCLGHASPILVDALTKQANKLWHVSNSYQTELQKTLAEKWTSVTFADVVFFTNSGTEAIEACLKTARKYHFEKGKPEKIDIIGFDGAFHGRSYGGINAAANPNYLHGFGPALPGFKQCKFGDLDALKAMIDEKTAGIILEPIQGEGGCRAATDEYLKGIRELCDANDILLIYDEVQSGAGRSGKLFAHEWSGVTPDIMAAAKGIGGGFPMGACLATEKAAVGMVKGVHGSTFGGNPLAMAVGHAVFGEITKPEFLENVNAMANSIAQAFEGLKDTYPELIEEVRGKGLLRGIKLTIDPQIVRTKAFNNGLLVAVAGGNVLRVVPPLIITQDDVSEAVAILDKALAETREELKNK
ncbi:aspartate aminotransferase family protein [Pseudaquidulcibacter saccharophilus]|uniref:aspartate aminotransferase family protein n=1 Tax=Pseudaquidulcibacter saccharophilus TaxID=2831900 RepID=UPI001EFF050A|nr:aspartate aminotransferase family protein [Pseudaquidulcibacter saccharophilus]